VEDGTVLLGPGLKSLADAMLAVPGDASQWDLVDAAGLCVRGFPKMPPEMSRLAGTEPSTAARATSYATRRPDPRPPVSESPHPSRPYRPPADISKPNFTRAIGYAVRRGR
jgi:hypothetical protein